VQTGEGEEEAKETLGYSPGEYIKDWDEVVEEAKSILQIQKENDYIDFQIQQRRKYDEYMNSEKWKEIRWLVLGRDNCVCVICKTCLATDCHHKSYNHFGEGNDKEINDCISLCHECHVNVHKTK
jgi:5-methylcytosine-specific restriction endonuclease McrA